MRSHMLEEITEGSTVCLVPPYPNTKGPGSSKMTVFYNPNMEFARDITVGVLSAILDKRRKLKILDGMAATGIRGIRIKKEVSNRFELVLNDVNPNAIKLIKKNLDLNNIQARIEQKNLNELLASEVFDYIDIDPFGSAVEFLDMGFQAIKRNGILGITTTDTSALCGAAPKVCIRRYLAHAENNYMCHEIGLRIFVGYVARCAAKFDRAIKPILCFSADHYFRIFVRVENGAKKADNTLSYLGYGKYNRQTGEIRTLMNYEHGAFGPLWLGTLFDVDALSRIEIRENFNTKKRLSKYLEIWKEEANVEALFYDTNELGKVFHCSPPPLERVLSSIRMLGYYAVHTHISPNGFKTNAPVQHIKSVYEMLNMK